jgi:hypothetical protein
MPMTVSPPDPKAAAEVLKYAAETRRFEIERFWQRFNVFWVVNAAAFAGYGALVDKGTTLPLVISCFGLVSSFGWTLQNRGSKYWQEAWEQKVEAIEHEALGTYLFSKPEPLKDRGSGERGIFPCQSLLSRSVISLSQFGCYSFLQQFQFPRN